MVHFLIEIITHEHISLGMHQTNIVKYSKAHKTILKADMNYFG
jgi:hypothetical protein